MEERPTLFVFVEISHVDKQQEIEFLEKFNDELEKVGIKPMYLISSATRIKTNLESVMEFYGDKIPNSPKWYSYGKKIKRSLWIKNWDSWEHTLVKVCEDSQESTINNWYEFKIKNLVK